MAETPGQDAILYLRTSEPVYRPSEVSQLAALKVFADSRGFNLLGAAVESGTAPEFPLWAQIRQDQEDGKLDVVVAWDAEKGCPAAWEGDLPVEWVERSCANCGKPISARGVHTECRRCRTRPLES